MENNNSSTFIVGAVREIKGTSVLVRLFNHSDQLVFFFNGQKYSGIILGSYIGIIRGQYTIVGKVEKEFAYDQLKDSTAQEFQKERFVREIEVKIIGSFRGERYEQGIVAFPQIFNDVVLLSDAQKNEILTGTNNLNVDTDNTIRIGTIWPDEIEFNLKWPNIFNSHIAIFGNTGSGKSNTLTKLYNELFKLDFKKKLINFGKSRFVVLDFNGEYVEKHTLINEKAVYNLNTKKNTSTTETYNEKNYHQIKIPNNKFWNKDMLSILFGATEQTQQPFLSRVLDFYFNDNESFIKSLPKYIVMAFSNVYASPNKDSLDLFKQSLKILKLDNNKVSEWIDNTLYNNTTGNFYSREKLEDWNLSNEFYYWNKEVDALNKEKNKIEEKLKEIDFNVYNNPMQYLQLASYFKMIYELRQNTIQYDHISPLLQRIEARIKDFSKIFRIAGPTEDPNVQEEIFKDVVNVVSLKDVNQDMKLLIPMILGKITYELNKELNKNHDRIFNLIVDEAHNILSESSSRESEKWKDYRLEVFEEIIKEGRKFGYYLTISSQRPADISPTIVSQVHNYFIHRLVNDNDLRLLDRTMSSLDSVSKESIPNLAPGQVIVTGVSFDLPIIIKIDQLQKEIAPNSANADLLEIWKKN